MVGYYNGSGRVLIERSGKGALFFILAAILLFNLGCGSLSRSAEEIPFKISANALTKWEDVFGEDEVLSFTQNGSEFEFYTIGSLSINSTGEYFIIDGKRGKIIQFDSSGEFKKFIGTKGEGPGEYFIIGALSMDAKDGLYIFDIPKMRINQYSAPGYNFSRQINYGKSIQDIIVTDNGDFILYASTIGEVLYKLNREGKVIQKTFKPKQDSFRLFISRFNLGRFCKLTETDFLFVYPEEYRIYLFDNDLKIKRILFANEPSRFFPTVGVFPKNLSPYDFTPKHAKWMSNSLYPAFIDYIGNRKFVVLLVEYQNVSEKPFINIHDTDGNTFAVGLEVPFGGIVRYAKDGYLYVVEKDSIDDKGNVLPCRLHRFKLKI